MFLLSKTFLLLTRTMDVPATKTFLLLTRTMDVPAIKDIDLMIFLIRMGDITSTRLRDIPYKSDIDDKAE